MRNKISDASEVNIDYPANLVEDDKIFFDNKYCSSPFWLISAKKVNILLAGIVGEKCHIHHYSIPQYRGKKKIFRKQYFFNVLFKRRQKIDDEVTIIHNPWCPGYFHWITEALVRLLLFEKDANDRRIALLLPEKFKKYPYVVESIRCITNREILYLKDKHIATAPLLKYISTPALTGFYNPELIIALKRKIIDNLRLKKVSPFRKIYVSRKLANNRFVINEKELVTLLANQGFETVYWEQLAFSDQVALMNETKCFVSIHGAGLTNLMFMPAGGCVLELQLKPKDKQGFSPSYYRLSAICKLYYLYQFCDSPDQDSNIYTANIYVDMKRVKHNLSIMASLC